ncbi:uncharacterized protein IL334_002743 [Kwoniella shivajii]|uniref:DH domain-containing protein n=1 Tax=Kwoniella shivajii TaxID=564305 RepID=A0ABZ1CXA2_9TREE|nr:hypothetical protein IL334_002743 [Kwoniella shivajii]
MKSLLSRFKNGPSSNERSSSSSTTRDKENVSPSKSNSIKKISSKSHIAERPQSTINAANSIKPGTNHHTALESARPHSVHGQFLNVDRSPVTGSWTENTNRHRSVSASSDIADTNKANPGGKKVTFRSPAPTPTTSVLLEDAINESAQLNPKSDDGTKQSSSTLPLKRSSMSTLRPPTSLSTTQVSRPTTSQSTNTNRPRPISRQTSPFLPSLAIRTPTFRKASLPPRTLEGRSTSDSPTKSSTILSPTPTPSEMSTGATSTMSYLPQLNSWSEMAEDELIANLGPKERTRQEVLWEIVSSEERYVQDLMRFNDTVCKSLIPISANSPHLDLYDPVSELSRTMSPASPALSGNESFVNLPIAARYASSRYSGERYPSDSSASTAPPVTPNDDIIARGTAGPPPSSAARMNAYNILTNGRPSHRTSFSSLKGTRSHQSLPPPATRQGSYSSQSNLHPSDNNNRTSYHPGFSSLHNKLHKASSRVSSGGSMNGRDVRLPEDLEKVLTVLSGGILEGHIKLAAALKRRYEDQYPLVRSLADVFTSHSYILREYSTYVLHLEKALSQVDETLTLFSDPAHPHTNKTKRVSKKVEDSEQGHLARKLLSLEELASERGEAGLIISLSKPFQRLLKYPLLFQNLLFNTDPSLKEYEATLSMVDEVEGIVRTIEDEKSNEEEREKTRDIWARIEGLEKDKLLMTPKSNRMLISETKLPTPEGSHSRAQKETTSVKGKKSFKRLSDILKGGDTAELWVVQLTDVSLLCERIGMTQLPIASFQRTSKSDSTNDHGSKRHSGMGKRSISIRARNLYRFVKVHEWHLKSKTGSTDALLKTNDTSTSRERSSETHESPPKSKYPTLPSIAGTPTKVPTKTTDGSSPAKSFRSRKVDDDSISMVSDGISEMSFAFKSGDQVKPNVRAKPKRSSSSSKVNPTNRISSMHASTAAPGKNRISSQSHPALQRRFSNGHVASQAANAKFAHRLRSPDLSNQSDNENGITPTGPKNRRSLPPTMMSGGLRPLQTATLATATAQVKPAWNLGNSTTLTTTNIRRASTPASSSQIGSIRNTSSPSITEGRRIPIGRSSTKPTLVNKPKIASAEQKEVNPDCHDDIDDKNEIKKMPSKEDSVVGLWKAFDETKGLGIPYNDTPEKDKPASIRGTSVRGTTPLRGITAPVRGNTSVPRGGAASVRGGSTFFVGTARRPVTPSTRESAVGNGAAAATRGTISARGTPPRLRANTPSTRGTPPRSRANTPSVRGTTATTSSVRGGSVTSAKMAGKAAAVGRGGTMVSSRKRDLGGKI